MYAGRLQKSSAPHLNPAAGPQARLLTISTRSGCQDIYLICSGKGIGCEVASADRWFLPVFRIELLVQKTLIAENQGLRYTF